MEAVADFERCVALLRGGDPGGATTALLSLRDNPRRVWISREDDLARSTDGDALFHALGALPGWRIEIMGRASIKRRDAPPRR